MTFHTEFLKTWHIILVIKGYYSSRPNKKFVEFQKLKKEPVGNWLNYRYSSEEYIHQKWLFDLFHIKYPEDDLTPLINYINGSDIIKEMEIRTFTKNKIIEYLFERCLSELASYKLYTMFNNNSTDHLTKRVLKNITLDELNHYKIFSRLLLEFNHGKLSWSKFFYLLIKVSRNKTTIKKLYRLVHSYLYPYKDYDQKRFKRFEKLTCRFVDRFYNADDVAEKLSEIVNLPLFIRKITLDNKLMKKLLIHFH
jgi:hypothetical protein